ncbi:MAG: uracil-DNA glycosylase [Epulopiscium sp. Nele67-Bin002]|nr:MAG: uracil-DNA glycosylase [Epulopiscium sp. Nuni2H_MBin001]OON90548.1 MAG: uracil-DNA glycosylase [Epulopiscium sp. Nele67-Bin001]OON92467.1 MAG: uracil-DNA glycosylase [Epulopiscium sp. Nele67-Bin002]
MLDNKWIEIIEKEKTKQYYHDLWEFVNHEYATAQVYPPKDKLLTALELTPLDNVKIVILGQDPYHGVNQAHGLAFSVQRGVPVPPSLKNIYKEINRTYKQSIPSHGNLECWATQGVLLLNAVLTVRANTAASHQKKGWEIFTDELIRAVNQKTTPVVFMLWGKFAISKANLITNPIHYILKTTHPSPLSANKGFLGCGHFEAANKILVDTGQTPIDWSVI